jgi:DNA invertase Pin-like site-specific DNA recombinase
MSDNLKIQDTHLRRSAYVYIRQSSATQVLVNRESPQRQYQLTERAAQLGWSKTQIKVIDEDLAHTGSGLVTRHGFAQMIQEVALGQVGLILCLEASRIARNNVEWYRLLELCGVTDTLIGDLDGLYHPGLFNDRLLLGLKGTMAEAKLHVLRTRLNGAIRNKAKRGELRRGLPVGLLWGEGEGEVVFHPDQAVTGALRTVFEKFAELGSARQVWLWFHSEGLSFPHECPSGQILWVKPTYIAVHTVLSNPVYAGAYYCANKQALNGRETWCLRVGGVRVDQAVVETFLEAISPAGLEAVITAQSLGEAEDQSALKQFRLQVERARYEAKRAERRFRSVEPENRLVARTLETEWESQLQDQRTLEAELARKEQEQRLQLTDTQREQIRALGSDLQRVWNAPTTTARDRKELLRSLLEEVKINVLTDEGKAHLCSVLRFSVGVIPVGLRVKREAVRRWRAGFFSCCPVGILAQASVDFVLDKLREVLPERGLDLATVFQGTLATGLLLGGRQGRW